jgi:acylphosphatase
MQTLRIRITGRVQGVFFRQSTKEIAQVLDVKGTVRNCEDHSVEVIATAPKEQLDQFINWCRQGPPKAIVSGVETEELSLQPFKKFSIIR